MTKKIFFIAVCVAIITAVVFIAFALTQGLRTAKDRETADVGTHISSKRDIIVVSKPKPLSVIASPLVVKGEARGPWYFEATFSIILTDWDGRIIAESYASAVLDPDDPDSTWMTEEFVPFKGIIEFENPSFPETSSNYFSQRGTLIFQKANPSGLPEHDDALEIPVVFEKK